ncbi:MAG: hypothetical protein ABIP95_07225 [Pelobium sp.]
MKQVSDKEFDGLFKSSFEDFEVQPSAKSWEKITNQLDAKPAGKKIPIFWSVAASVIVVLGIGIGLYTKPTAVIKLRPDQTEEMMANLESERTKGELAEDNRANVAVENITEGQNYTASHSSFTPIDNSKELAALNSVASEKNISNDATKGTTNSVLNTNTAIQNTKQQELVQVKPNRPTTVTERILAEEASKIKPELETKHETVLAQNTIDENLGNSANINRRSKIKSVGDLVNFVVAKVDKRDDKIIEVSRTDESDNEVTGINLGLFKFRKSEK